MICRHYWPHLSLDAACRDVCLADGLRRAGVAVEVLTSRAAPHWPARLMHREIPLHRPIQWSGSGGHWPRTPWSQGRYQHALESWLSQHLDRFDVLMCTSLQEELVAMVQARGSERLRRIAVHSGTSETADCRRWQRSRAGKKIRSALGRVDALVACWASVQRQLLASGVDSARLVRIDLGVPERPDGDAIGQLTAAATGSAGGSAVASGGDLRSNSSSLAAIRASLARANGDLMLHRDSPVVLVCGSMSRHSGMGEMIQAMPRLLDRWPDLRLWLIGDGPERQRLHDHCRQIGVRQNVAMPGTFVALEDLLRLADVLVIPSGSEGLEYLLPTAVSAAVPLLVADTIDTRSFFRGEESLVQWLPDLLPLGTTAAAGFAPATSPAAADTLADAASDSSSASATAIGGAIDQLASLVHQTLANLPARRAAARQLRTACLKRRPWQDTIDAYCRLFDPAASAGRWTPPTNLPDRR